MRVHARRMLTLTAGLLTATGGAGFAVPAFASQGSGSGGSFNVDITSATNVNPTAETVTLPLFEGSHNGQAVYYVITDDSSKADAAARGVNWSPKLANALGTSAVENASTVNGMVQFPGIVDFSPTRVVTPGPPGNEFPGAASRPVRSATYSTARSSPPATGLSSMPPRSPTTQAPTTRS